MIKELGEFCPLLNFVLFCLFVCLLVFCFFLFFCLCVCVFLSFLRGGGD